MNNNQQILVAMDTPGNGHAIFRHDLFAYAVDGPRDDTLVYLTTGQCFKVSMSAQSVGAGLANAVLEVAEKSKDSVVLSYVR